MNYLNSVWGAIILFLVHPACSLAVESPWGDLSSWVGKYPTIDEAGHKRRLWEQPAVRSSLQTLLDRADLEKLDSTFGIAKPVVQVDHFIVVEQCLPHNCPSDHAMVVLDTEHRRMWVGFYERTEKVVSTRWYGSEDYILLPTAILETFRRAHAAR
jgi:hypothetical protein